MWPKFIEELKNRDLLSYGRFLIVEILSRPVAESFFIKFITFFCGQIGYLNIGYIGISSIFLAMLAWWLNFLLFNFLLYGYCNSVPYKVLYQNVIHHEHFLIFKCLFWTVWCCYSELYDVGSFVIPPNRFRMAFFHVLKKSIDVNYRILPNLFIINPGCWKTPNNFLR